jgi:hypothetical protein
MSNPVQDVIVDGFAGSGSPAEAPRADNISPSQDRVPSAADAVDLRLQRVEARLIALAGGDAALERDVRRYVAESSARFATARVRQFVPILVEREVRDRLRAQYRAGAVERTA